MMELSEESSEKSLMPIMVIRHESEEERLRREVFRPDAEKFKLFAQMLRVNKLYNKAKLTHKK